MHWWIKLLKEWSHHSLLTNSHILWNDYPMFRDSDMFNIIAFSDFYTPSKQLFLELKLLNLHDHIKHLNILFLHQLLNNKLPAVICNTFQLSFCNTKGRNARLKIVYTWSLYTIFWSVFYQLSDYMFMEVSSNILTL